MSFQWLRNRVGQPVGVQRSAGLAPAAGLDSGRAGEDVAARRDSKPAEAITVGLLWHSVNSDNMGVGALTISHLALIERAAAAMRLPLRIRVIGWFDRREPYVAGPGLEVVPLRTRHFVKPSGGLFSEIRRCDVVFDIGAGDSFADIYGLRRFALLAASKALVLAARRPLVLAPQTIGPFERPWARAIAKRLIRRCRAVVVRDHPSWELLQKLAPALNVLEATDIAFGLPPAAGTPAPAGHRVKVGVNASALLFNGGYTRGNMFGLAMDYARFVRRLLERLAQEADCEVHLVSHVISDTHEVEDDYRLAQRLAEEFPGTIVAPRFTSPGDAKAYIGAMDFFCGSRMHACIAAFSSGVPTMPIAYSRKFAGVFASIGYRHTIDCRAASETEAVEAILGAFRRRAALRDEVRRASELVDRRLRAYENLVGRCLSEAVRRRP